MVVLGQEGLGRRELVVVLGEEGIENFTLRPLGSERDWSGRGVNFFNCDVVASASGDAFGHTNASQQAI